MKNRSSLVVAVVERQYLGYLSEYQLHDIKNKNITSGELLVKSDNLVSIRPFVWLYVEEVHRWLLANMITGTLYSVETGRCVSGGPRSPYIIGDLPLVPVQCEFSKIITEEKDGILS